MKSSDNQQVKLRKIVRRIINEEFMIPSPMDRKPTRYTLPETPDEYSDLEELAVARKAIGRYRKAYPAVFAQMSPDKLDELEQWLASCTESDGASGSWSPQPSKKDFLKFVDYLMGGKAPWER
jgi:hypothetical protein